MALPEIALGTATGSVRLVPVLPSEDVKCMACTLRNGSAVHVLLDNQDLGREDDIVLCGNCLVAGCAVHMGAQHVRSGGVVEDLTFGR